MPERANSATPRSISSASRTPTGVNSTPSECAPDWIAANWPTPATDVELRRTAARVMLGATCLSNSTHLPPKLYSKLVKPVALPPGRARLCTHPAPTGSGTFAITIGIVRVACSTGVRARAPAVTITSGVSATNSATCRRKDSASLPGKRYSIKRLAPTVQSRCRRVSSKAGLRASTSGSPAEKGMSTPTRRIRSGGCARAASGHATTAPPRSVMNSRRFMPDMGFSPSPYSGFSSRSGSSLAWRCLRRLRLLNFRPAQIKECPHDDRNHWPFRASRIACNICLDFSDTELVIADLSRHNANAFYGLAIRHVIRLPTIHMIHKGWKLPFDVDRPASRGLALPTTGRPYDTQAPTYYRVPKTKAKR